MPVVLSLLLNAARTDPLRTLVIDSSIEALLHFESYNCNLPGIEWRANGNHPEGALGSVHGEGLQPVVKTRDTAPQPPIFLVLMVDEYSHKSKKQAWPRHTTARVSPAGDASVIRPNALALCKLSLTGERGKSMLPTHRWHRSPARLRYAK